MRKKRAGFNPLKPALSIITITQNTLILFFFCCNCLFHFFFLRQNNLVKLPDIIYFILKDFKSYAEAQKKVEAAYKDEKGWAKSAILNTACSGKFTSDRTIQDEVSICLCCTLCIQQ